MGLSITTLEQVLLLKQREATPLADTPLRKTLTPRRRETYLG
jgi:hypothetical protein